MSYKPFSVQDSCPLCGKKCMDSANEHGGRIMQFYEIFIVCIRCGTVFVPRSRIKHVFEMAVGESKKSEQVAKDETDKREDKTELQGV